MVNVCEIVEPLELVAPPIDVFTDGTQSNVTLLVILELSEILVLVPEHMICEVGLAVADGVGFIVIIKVFGVPEQVGVAEIELVNFGVTVIVAVMGAVPVFTPVNDGILPVPLAPNPIAVLLLVQSYTVPATVPVKVINPDEALLQMVRAKG